MFCEKNIFMNFRKLLRKHLCCSPATLLKREYNTGAFQWIFRIKKRLQHRCFPVNFAKLSEQLFDSILVNGCFWSKYEMSKTSKNVIVYILWRHNVYKKLVMTEFCKIYNLPNLSKEKTYHKIPQKPNLYCPFTRKFCKPNYAIASFLVKVCHKKGLIKNEPFRRRTIELEFLIWSNWCLKGSWFKEWRLHVFQGSFIVTSRPIIIHPLRTKDRQRQ